MTEGLVQRRFDASDLKAIGRRAALLGGPLLFALIQWTEGPEAVSPEAWSLLAIAAWMILWWMTEAVPLAATALIPLVLFPITGVLPEGSTASNYAHPLIFLFLGGFLLGAALQQVGLHRRLALAILRRVGTSPSRQLAGFIGTAAFLSMWISNTATAIMMFPVALSVIEVMQEKLGKAASESFGKSLMLGTAYGCSLGGAATLIGTPPNALAAAYASEHLGFTITFARWMSIGLPFATLMLVFTWWWLSRRTPRLPQETQGALQATLDDLARTLGPWRKSELWVGIIGLCAAVAWIFRPWLISWTGLPLTDTSIALVAGLALLCLPSPDKPDQALLPWADALRIPWGVLLLFGGGLALASAFSQVGLTEVVGSWLTEMRSPPLFVALALSCGIVLMLTELTSNTATTATFLPLVAAAATAWAFAPVLFLAGLALAASAAFMLPVATPPNAVVFGYGPLRVIDMARSGALLNVVGLLWLTLLLTFAGSRLLGV